MCVGRAWGAMPRIYAGGKVGVKSIVLLNGYDSSVT